MQVKLSSQKHEILDYGTVYLFDKNADLTFDITTDNAFRFSISIIFKEDESMDSRVITNTTEQRINFSCINFTSRGIGMTAPYEVAIIDGKKIFFIFWAYLEGKKSSMAKVRKVEYTLYREQ